MRIHDWTRVKAGTFHDFHQAWTIAIRNALNRGGLPPDYFAMADQGVSGPIPDVIALHRHSPSKEHRGATPATAQAPPKARFVTQAREAEAYARRANRIVIRHEEGEVVAVIEIASPGNKSSRQPLRTFVKKARALLENDIHLLIVDLFPPSRRHLQGIHGALWAPYGDDSFRLPADKPLTVASYSAGPPITAYVEPVAVGDTLPDMPIFLTSSQHVPAPLEATYCETWEVCPAPIRERLESEET
jgi:hypothetical protein